MLISNVIIQYSLMRTTYPNDWKLGVGYSYFRGKKKGESKSYWWWVEWIGRLYEKIYHPSVYLNWQKQLEWIDSLTIYRKFNRLGRQIVIKEPLLKIVFINGYFLKRHEIVIHCFLHSFQLTLSNKEILILKELLS